MGQTTDFPKYLMKINGNRKFLSFREAYVAYNSGSAEVEIGSYVLNEDFSARKMTVADRSKISGASDAYSASK